MGSSFIPLLSLSCCTNCDEGSLAIAKLLHPLAEQCGGPPCSNCSYILGLASGTLSDSEWHS